MSQIETRSATKGKPLKKPGAYNTDNYYAEKDQGFGDVGVDQEPDAGTRDDPDDPDFTVSKEEVDASATRADEGLEDVNPSEAKAELEDLQRPADSGQEAVDEAGEPVPLVDDVNDEDLPDADAAAGVGI